MDNIVADSMERSLTDEEVRAIFTPDVMEGESAQFRSKRRAWNHRLTKEQSEWVTVTRRRRQNCAYAKRSRARRLSHVTDGDSRVATMSVELRRLNHLVLSMSTAIRALTKENDTLRRACQFLGEKLHAASDSSN